LAACASSDDPKSGGNIFGSIFSADFSAKQPRAGGGGQALASAAGAGAAAREGVVYLGSGQPGRGSGETVSSFEPGEFTLNFQNADLREVVQAILGNSLQVNYTVDPTVAGTVTISSARPVTKDDLLPILEMVLQMNGAALVKDDEVYRVVAETSAVAGWGDVGDAKPGYGISILPLKFVSAQTLISLIDGFGTRPGSVRAEAARNLLIVLGNSADRQAAIETALSFDADWMQDQAVAIVPLRTAKPEVVIPELERIFKTREGGLGADTVQFVPMVRLKGVLVVAQNADLIARARVWIERLDTDNPDLESDIYVYRVKYRDARKLADLVGRLFSEQGAAGAAGLEQPGEQVEPGATPVESEGFTQDTGQQQFGQQQFGEQQYDEQGNPIAAAPEAEPFLQASEPAETEAASVDTRIQADVANNSIVIYADLETREKILAALRRIDVPQMQVAVNVTMAEIRLTDELRFGVQYFVKSGSVGLGDDEGSFGLFDTLANNIGRDLPGFNLVLGSNASPDVIISAFDSVTDVQVLSSPSLVVHENETAKFQVGDQVPIVTRTVSDPVSSGDNGIDFATSNEVEYRDTGIILSVKPRIAENGVVSMTIEQEISSVAADSNSLTPTISNRRVASSISVVDGQTVLLGGLISEGSNHGQSGIPGLHRLRGIGALFGRRGEDSNRTELIILIRPTVIRDSYDAQRVAEDLRSRLWSLGASKSR
jgi:general secretion pathway protein D